MHRYMNFKKLFELVEKWKLNFSRNKILHFTMAAMKREEKGDTYSRFPPPPPPASPCRRRKTHPWQLESSVSLPLHGSASPHPTHPTIIPDFYSSSSAKPQILSTSQRPSCLTSLLLSAQVCVPKCQPSLCWLVPHVPCPWNWLGRRQGRHQTISPAVDAKPNPATFLIFPQWEQSQICTKPLRCWHHWFSSFSCSFFLKFCPAGWGVLSDSSPTQLLHSPPCHSGEENQRGKMNLVCWDKNSLKLKIIILIVENNNINKNNYNNEKARGREIKPKRNKWCPVLTTHWSMPSSAPSTSQTTAPSLYIEYEVP